MERRSKKCLICYSSSQEDMGKLKNEDCFGNTGILAEETIVVFVVRNLLKVPGSVCERFLKDLGSPSEWSLTFCVGCQELLNDAKEVAKMIYTLEGKLNGLRNKIQTEIHNSYKDAGEPPRRNFHKHLEALDEIRYCVAKGFDDHDKENEIAEESEDDFRYEDCDNASNYSDGDYKEEIEKSSISARKPIKTKEDYAPRLRRLRPRTPQKPKPIKPKKKIDPELFKTIVPTVVPLNDDLKKETVDPVHQESSHDVGEQNSISNPNDFEEKSNNLDDNEQGELLNPNKSEQDNADAAPLTVAERYLKLVQSAKFRAERKPDGSRMKQTADKPFKCSNCKWRYSSELLLTGHINRVHKGLKFQYPCELCNRGFNRRSLLEKHLRSHVKNGKKFACSQCSSQFFTQIRLDVHTQKIHMGNKKPLACQLCERKFDSLYRLEHHLQEAHEMTVQSDEVKRSGIRPSLKRKKFKCPKCVRSFSTEDTRYSHVQRKHNGVENPYPCKICGKGFIYKNVLDTHLRSHERKASRPSEFVCELCGKRFSTKPRLRDHHKCVHENRKDFICEICSSLFKSKKSLNHHQATRHLNVLDIRHFACSQCTRTFGTEGSLKHHVDRIHNNIYQFRCSYCPKGSKSQADIQDHENTHTGAKPHKCETCGKSFASRKQIACHNRIHTGEKPYHCDTCGQDFADRTWFKRHQETHTGIIHNCHICGKGFPIKHNLGIHMKSHLNKNSRNNKQMQNPSHTPEPDPTSTTQPTEIKLERDPPRKKRRYKNESESSDEYGNGDEYQCRPVYT